MSSFQAWGKRVAAALLVALTAAHGAYAAGPMLSVSASPSPGVVGSNVTVSVQVTDIVDLYGFQYSLAFNPSILQASSVSEGSFLSGGGSTFFGGGTTDNIGGSISLTFNSLLGAVPGVSGSGTVAQVVFNVVAAGSTTLGLSDVLFLDSALAQITLPAQGGSLITTAVPEPSAALMLGLGLAGVAMLRRRKTAA